MKRPRVSFARIAPAEQPAAMTRNSLVKEPDLRPSGGIRLFQSQGQTRDDEKSVEKSCNQ
jgi:hypothetical protein